jgi:hypothetical protein
MKHSLFLLLAVVVLAGCPPYEESTYRVYYHSDKHTSGQVPTDSKKYRKYETATVQGQGNLQYNDYIFLGWRHNGAMRYSGDNITINWDDINLYAAWDDGTDTPFEFTVTGGEVTITRYNEEYSRSIVIPNTLQSKPVTAIDDNVFSNFYISSVSLPTMLKRIGIGAFASNEITQITIPDSVTSIGMAAFQNNSLRRITLGNGLRTIEKNAFRNNLLVEITIPTTITSIRAEAFEGNEIEMIKIGAGVTIESDSALGNYGASFRTYYNDGGQQAGLYLHSDNDIWERSTSP